MEEERAGEQMRPLLTTVMKRVRGWGGHRKAPPRPPAFHPRAGAAVPLCGDGGEGGCSLPFSPEAAASEEEAAAAAAATVPPVASP